LLAQLVLGPVPYLADVQVRVPGEDADVPDGRDWVATGKQVLIAAIRVDRPCEQVDLLGSRALVSEVTVLLAQAGDGGRDQRHGEDRNQRDHERARPVRPIALGERE